MTQHPPATPTRPGPAWQRWLADPPAVARLPWLSSGAVLLIQLVGSTFAGQNQAQADHRIDLDPFGYALLVLGPLLLLLRHRNPPVATLGTATAALLYLAAGYPYGPVFLSVVVGAFAAVVRGHRRAGWAAMGLFWTGLLLAGHVLYRWLPPGGDEAAEWAMDVALAAWVIAALAVSELVRARREQLARERAEREAAERRRADEERLRIARELHDVLAHSISVINVQAGVGLALLDTDPNQARTALTTIKSASKEALREVRQVLASLRAPGDAPRAPAPGLARLPELAAQAGGAGLRVETVTEGGPVPLPPGADLAAFRIVQEALTNTVRHSGSRAARVLLRYTPDALELRIDDDGPVTGGSTGGGNGLVGMRERAAAFGGTVRAGPRGDGGWRVTARLPLTPTARPESGSGSASGSGEDGGADADGGARNDAAPGAAPGDGTSDGHTSGHSTGSGERS